MEMYRRVKLPSHGKFYPGSDVDIVIDAITFDDEKKIFSSSTEEAIDEVMNKCIKSPEDFDVTQLTPEDRKYLLYQLRIHSYGDEYHVKDFNGKEYPISLEDMELVELGDDFTLPHGKLPVKGVEITISKPTVGELRKISRQCRERVDKVGGSYTEMLYEALQAAKIGTVGGEKLSSAQKVSFLHTLSGRDSAYIDYLASKIEFGYTGLIKVSTDTGEKEITVAQTGEFFRPRFDD